MSDFYTASFHLSPVARRHRRRKRFSKLAVLSGLIGWLSVAISVVLFLLSQLCRNDVERRFLVLATLYLSLGVFCLLIQKLLQYMNARLATAERPPQGVPFDAPHQRRGGALVLVLSALAVVALWVAHAQVRTVMTRRQNERVLIQARLQAAASSAIFFALQQLADDEDPLCDHTNEIWCLRRDWKDPSGISIRLEVTDQNRFFDVNNVAAQLSPGARMASDIMADLMTLCGNFTPENRVEALTDWIDADQNGVLEAAFYTQQGRPPPANRVLYTWGEWLSVYEFDREYFRRRERTAMYELFKEDPLMLFTVIPKSRRQPIKVNVNTASASVLTGLLGLDRENAAMMLVNMRNKRPFRNVDELAGVIPHVFKSVRDYLDIRSRFFTICAQAYAQDHVEAVFALAERTAEGQIEIRHWVMM